MKSGDSPNSGVDAKVEHPHVTGDLRVHEFRSRIFGNVRTLRILVPEGYDDPANRTKQYPVLYLNDGQNLFDSTSAVLNPTEWRVDEAVDSLVGAGEIAPLIIVGVDNAGRRGRFKEYFPYIDAHLDPPEPNPQGKRYPEFLADELIPFIERTYRVSPDAANRGIGGSSAGALAAIYTVVTRPGLFGRLLVESPSIYVDDAQILKDAADVPSWPERIYLGGGTNEVGRSTCDPLEQTESELVRDLRRFEKLLLESRVEPTRIRVLITPCGRHNEAAWAARFPVALTFLFGSTS